MSKRLVHGPKATPWHRARHGFKREPDLRRAGDERLEWPFTPAPAITRCWCSTSLATSNAVLCVAATCTALTAGTTCSSPSWRTTRARPHASIFERMRPLQCPRSTSFWRRSGLNTRSGYRPTRFCRAGSAICSRAQSDDLRTMCAGSMPISAIRPEPGPSRGGLSPRSSGIPKTLSPRRLHPDKHEPPGRAHRCVLQQARDVRAMDQGGQRRDQVDATVVPNVRRQRGAAPASCAPYNRGNFLRTLATPEPIKDWSLTSLTEKLIKIGAKVVSHGHYVAFQMAEVAIARQ